MTFTTITPSTVANGDQFPASTYNTIVADINDHESRLSAVAPYGHQVLTTAQKTALTGVTTGTMVYDSTLGRYEVWNGSAWAGITTSVKVPAVEVVRTTNYSWTNGTSFPWSSATYDTDGMWNGSNVWVTINTPGIYSISAYVQITGTSLQTIASYLLLNAGGSNVSAPFWINLSSNIVGATVCATASLSAGAQVSITPTVGNGTSLQIHGASTPSRLAVTYLGKSS